MISISGGTGIVASVTSLRWLKYNDPEHATREQAVALLDDLQSGLRYGRSRCGGLARSWFLILMGVSGRLRSGRNNHEKNCSSCCDLPPISNPAKMVAKPRMRARRMSSFMVCCLLGGDVLVAPVALPGLHLVDLF